MSEQIYSDPAIRDYLLGSLPEAETERFDELSFTDDEFANKLKTAEKDLVDAYVQGELIEPELERFKSYYLASPLRRGRVEFARAFQLFAENDAVLQATEAEAGGPLKPARKRKPLRWFSGLSVFTRRRLALQWGFAAAALALLLAGGLLVFQNTQLRRQMSQAQASRDVLSQREQELQKEVEGQRATNAKTEQDLAQVRAERERLDQELSKTIPPPGGGQQSSRGESSIVSLILASPLRGGGKIPAVSIPPRASSVAAQLQLEADDYSAYRVALMDPSNHQILWRSGTLKARAKGNGKVLSVMFQGALLKPRNYVLQVSGLPARGASEIISDYPFQVVK